MDAEEKMKEEEMMAVEDFGDSRPAQIRYIVVKGWNQIFDLML